MFSAAMILNFQRYQAREKHNRESRRVALEKGDMKEYERIVVEPFQAMDTEFIGDVKTITDVVGVAESKLHQSFDAISQQDPTIQQQLSQIWQSVPNTTVENPVFNKKGLTEEQIISLYDDMTETIRGFKYDASSPESGMVVKSLYANDMMSKKHGYEHEDLLMDPRNMSDNMKRAFERCYTAMKDVTPIDSAK